MPFNSDGYAATLLTIALSPNREEYARPLGNQEYYQLEERVRESNAYRTIGDLFSEDISGLMLRLDISEEEAYRIYTLLNRGVTFLLCNRKSCRESDGDRFEIRFRVSAAAHVQNARRGAGVLLSNRKRRADR